MSKSDQGSIADPYPIPPSGYMFSISGKSLVDNPEYFLSAGRRSHRLLLSALKIGTANPDKSIFSAHPFISAPNAHGQLTGP